MSKTVMRDTNEKLREFEMRDVSKKKKKKVPPPPPPLPFKKKKKKKKPAPLPPPPPSFSNRTKGEEKKTSVPPPPPSFSNKTDGKMYDELESELSSQGGNDTFEEFTSQSKHTPKMAPPPPPKKKFRRPKHTLSDPDTIDENMASFEIDQSRRTSWIHDKAPSNMSKCRYVGCFVCDRTCCHKDKKIRYTSRVCCGITCCLILAYLIFAMVMIFELLALQGCNDSFRDPPCFEMTRLELVDMTTNDIPIELDATLNLPVSSSVKVDIGYVTVSIYDRDNQVEMIRTGAQPVIEGGNTITGGTSNLIARDVMTIPGVSSADRKRFRRLNGADSVIVSEAEKAMGKMLGEVLNFKETQMQFKANALISTSMFLFPIDYNFVFEAPLSCGFLYESQYETLEESKANGEKNKCGENWSLEEKTDSACAYFCQMDEFPMVDPTADDDDDDDDKNETVVMNSVEVWATTENQNDVAVTLSLDILLGNEWVMIIHLPPIEMDIHTSFVAHDAFDLSNAALQEPKLARGWTDQTLVVNQTFNLVVNSALEVNMTQWHADRMAEIVEASVRQDPIYLFIRGDKNANTTQLTQRVMNEAGALRIKIAYDDPNAKDALEIQEESYSVVAKRFGFAGWRDNTISMIMDFAMNMDFGIFGTIPPTTIDVFTDAGRMVTIMVPSFEIGYATSPLPEGGQNVSTLVQFYSAYPTHNVWGSVDLLTCGRFDEETGNLTETYDIFNIGIRGGGSLDHAYTNYSEFQFMSSILRGLEIEMLKINGSDYVCMNNKYYCYPIEFEENGLYENVTIDEDGNIVVKQGDVIDSIDFTTKTDTQIIDSVLNLTFGPKLLNSDQDLGFELEIGRITLEMMQGSDAPSPMAQFDFKGLQIGMGSIEEWLAFEFLVPDATYGDALGQFLEDIGNALSQDRELAQPVPLKLDGNLILPRGWATITAFSNIVPAACVNEIQTICIAEANAVILKYPVHPDINTPLPGTTLEALVECLQDNFATLSEECHTAVHAGQRAFENVETEDILRAVRGGWNSTYPNISSCTNFTALFDEPSDTSEAAKIEAEAERVLRSLDIVGGDSIGSDIVIPCVLEMICPDNTDDIDLTDKSFIGRALISVNNAAKQLGVNNLTVIVPEIAFETGFSSLGLGSLDVYTEFMTFKLGEINFAASAQQESEEDESLTDIFAYLTLDNVWLLHNIINRFMGAFDSRIRVRGAQIGTVDGATLLSQVLNRFEIVADIATTQDQFDEFGNPVAIGETVDPPSFWYPTQCEGSWNTYESASNSLSTIIQIPNLQNLTKMSLPLDLIFENFQISALYDSIEVCQILPGDGSDFVVLQNGTSPETALLKLLGENSAPYYQCRDGVTVKPGNENKCALSTFMQNLVDGALTEPFVGSDAMNTSLDFSVHLQYTNAILGGTQWIKMDLRLWDEPTSEGELTVCEHECNDFNALEPHFTETVCDTADFVLSGFESIMSAVGNLVGLNDLYVTLQIRLNNIFAFRMSVDYITLTVKYDDPDGVDNWLLGTLPAGYDLMLIDRTGITVSPTYKLEPGERSFSEAQSVNVGDITGELFKRLYDEVASKGRLCIHLFLSLDILIGDNQGRDEFAVTIPLEIKHLSTIGNTDCTNTGECVPILTELVDITSFSSTEWTLVGDAKIETRDGTQTLVVNDYSNTGTFNFDTSTGAAWYKNKIFVENSFETLIKFKTYDVRNLAADGFTFTIQNDKSNAIGTHSSDTGWGAKGISNSISVAVDVWMNNEVDIFTGGQISGDDWSWSSSGNYDDGNLHTMLIRYDHIKFILSLYIDDMQNAVKDMEINLSEVLNTNDGRAWVGVTAQGGGLNREEFWIKEFTYSVTMTDITNTIFVGNGMLAATMDSNGIASGSFTIISRTSCSVEQRRGGDNWSIELQCTNNAGCPPSRVVVTGVTDNSDGTYSVNFSVTSAGTWQVYVSLPDEDPNLEHNVGYFLVN